MDMPQITHRGLTKPRENLERLERDLAGATRAFEVEGAALRAAKDADAKALADALRGNREEPTPMAPAVAERYDAAKLRLAALRQAVEDARADLDEARKANAPAIEQQIGQALSKTRGEFLEILHALEMKHAEIGRQEAQLAWVAGGKWLPDRDRTVPGMQRPNGDDMPVSELLAALRARGYAPEPTGASTLPAPLSQGAVGRGLFVG